MMRSTHRSERNGNTGRQNYQEYHFVKHIVRKIANDYREKTNNLGKGSGQPTQHFEGGKIVSATLLDQCEESLDDAYTIIVESLQKNGKGSGFTTKETPLPHFAILVLGVRDDGISRSPTCFWALLVGVLCVTSWKPAHTSSVDSLV